MITLTENAAQKVKGILEQEKESIPAGGLRIYVQGGGCSGFSYGMVLDEAADGTRSSRRKASRSSSTP
jgi:iron-sulfur cluster assembly protein